MLCFAVPGTVAGVSYILAFNNAPLYITGTSIIVIISMVMRDLPIGMRAAIAGLGQLDKSLDEASLSLKGSSLENIMVYRFTIVKTSFTFCIGHQLRSCDDYCECDYLLSHR